MTNQEKESTAEMMRLFEKLKPEAKGYVKGYLACAKQMANEEAKTDQEKSHDHKQTEGK